jgi:hypothetical protein
MHNPILKIGIFFMIFMLTVYVNVAIAYSPVELGFSVSKGTG